MRLGAPAARGLQESAEAERGPVPSASPSSEQREDVADAGDPSANGAATEQEATAAKAQPPMVSAPAAAHRHCMPLLGQHRFSFVLQAAEVTLECMVTPFSPFLPLSPFLLFSLSPLFSHFPFLFFILLHRPLPLLLPFSDPTLHSFSPPLLLPFPYPSPSPIPILFKIHVNFR